MINDLHLRYKDGIFSDDLSCAIASLNGYFATKCSRLSFIITIAYFREAAADQDNDKGSEYAETTEIAPIFIYQ